MGAISRGLVDRVDHVDVRVGRQAVLHCGLATGDRARGRLMAGDHVVATLAAGVFAGFGLLAVQAGAARVYAHALEEAVVALDVHRDDLVIEQVQHGDHGLAAVQLRGGVLADQLAGRLVVSAVGDVHGARWRRHSVERDHVQPGLARLGQFGVYGVAVLGDQDALITTGDGVVDGADLGLRVAVLLAGRHRQVDVVLRGLRLRVLLHRHEVVVGQGLQDQRDTGFPGGRAAGWTG